MTEQTKNYEKLRACMEKYTVEDVIVAFSGGVDSSLLLKIACETAGKYKTRVTAVMMQTRLHPVKEIEHAKKVAEEVNASFQALPVDELAEAGILNNPPDRCYLCKKHLFERLKEYAGKMNVCTILEGTNADDLREYRPGLKAIAELGIKSPLAEAGITKEEVRYLAAAYKISVHNRPSTPCLATRFPYGTGLTYEKLRMAEQGEAFLKGMGIYNVRLRVHDDIVRIEVDEQDFSRVMEHKQEITETLKGLGYVYVTLDLEGFRSGSMDIHLKPGK